MPGVFITGTSTCVGKTYTAVLLARQLVNQGITVIPRKPVESGCINHNDELIPEDAIALQKAANYSESLFKVCSHRYEAALSPPRAAQLVNQTVTTEQLSQVCLNESANGFLLVEGAGGFYSPIAVDGLNADLAVSLQLPVILVAEDTIGCINQVMLSVEAIKHRGLILAAVVLNKLTNTTNENMDNAADLRNLLHCLIVNIPYSSANSTEELPAELINHILSAQPMPTHNNA